MSLMLIIENAWSFIEYRSDLPCFQFSLSLSLMYNVFFGVRKWREDMINEFGTKEKIIKYISYDRIYLLITKQIEFDVQIE